MERPIFDAATALGQVYDLEERVRGEALRLFGDCCLWAYMVHFSEWRKDPESVRVARETLAICEGRLHGFLESCQKAPDPDSAA